MVSHRSVRLATSALLVAGVASPLGAQESRVDDVTVAEVVLLSELAGAPRDAGAEWESAALDRLLALLRDAAELDHVIALGALGERGTALLVRGNGFRRDVVAALAGPDPSSAVDAVVDTYLDDPETSFPAAPKSMDVLYDHNAALAFRTRFPDLSGMRWAGEWYRLATTEPLTDLPAGPERTAGLDTVEARYLAKLTHGDPPDAFPTELPLAPAIAPGLVWVSQEAAMIWDNHSMFVEVVADILASPDLEDREAAIRAAVDFFTDPAEGVTASYDWEIMALRHGIFFQGGFPLAVMTESERNRHSHGAHMRSGAPMVLPGMIGR